MIKLSEDRIIQAITEWAMECDADEFARVTGELFGGECFAIIKNDEIVYEFEPNINYGGEFGEDNNE